MSTLGQKLRELRHHKGFKLNEVAEGADLSISFISLIERDKASISVENLIKLANFYNVRLYQVFQDIEEEDAYIVAEEELKSARAPHSDTKPTFFSLSSDDNLSFKSFLTIIPPGVQETEIKLQKGETFIYIKEGELEIYLPNKKPLYLGQGDTAHLTSYKGTLLKNPNADLPVKMLIVASATTQIVDNMGDPFHIYQFSQ
ncbi:MAG: helix-turn-helix transcriptional regulator [Chloroflexi bacterium]|jgi:transcriptional regulator with XRE-family HTH domain|nr:helix-turn-helix transcriptional regulator [Chloroflexota bacterium]